jgi:hypothetical protein
MAEPEDPDQTQDSEMGSNSPFAEVRYSLATLMREVKRDRASAAFAMEKLDQPTINLLFERQRLRRDVKPNQ